MRFNSIKSFSYATSFDRRVLWFPMPQFMGLRWFGGSDAHCWIDAIASRKESRIFAAASPELRRLGGPQVRSAILLPIAKIAEGSPKHAARTLCRLTGSQLLRQRALNFSAVAREPPAVGRA